jgi:hypothetical protein
LLRLGINVIHNLIERGIPKQSVAIKRVIAIAKIGIDTRNIRMWRQLEKDDADFYTAATMTFDATTATSCGEPFAVCSLIDEVRSAMMSIVLVIESA